MKRTQTLLLYFISIMRRNLLKHACFLCRLYGDLLQGFTEALVIIAYDNSVVYIF